MSIINIAVYSGLQDYFLASHYKIRLTKGLYIFYRELQVQRLEYDYYDDIYPSILKLQASPSKGFLLSIYYYCKSLCNKVYSILRLWCIRV